MSETTAELDAELHSGSDHGAVMPGAGEMHVVSYATNVSVWVALIVLTGLTVAVSGIKLHGLSVLTAIAVATIKTLLVLSIFMHLKYEHGVFKVFMIVTVITLGIFISLTFVDIQFR